MTVFIASLDFEITKNGKKVYRATYDGEEIYKSAPTHRVYYQMIFCKNSEGTYNRERAFGRPDLVKDPEILGDYFAATMSSERYRDLALNFPA